MAIIYVLLVFRLIIGDNQKEQYMKLIMLTSKINLPITGI